MIASRIGLLVATAIAVLLAIAVIVDLARDDAAPASRALVDKLDVEQVTRLSWSRSGEPEVVIVRAGETWQWSKPVAGLPADASAVDAALAALRGGRWHRRADVEQAGPLRVAVTATAGTRTVKIGIGKALEGAGQTWLAIGEHAYLVDDWIARALAPEPLALRETRPLRHAASAKTIVIERVLPSRYAVRIEGPKLVRPIELRLHPELLTTLHRALSQLTIRSIPTSVDPAIEMTISIDTPRLVTVEVRTAGCAGGDVAIAGTLGTGCVSSEDFGALDQAMKQLASPSIVVADQVPARVVPLRITLPDGGVLDLEKRPRIADRDADPTRVAELLAVLQTSVDAVDADPAAKPVATLVVTDRSGATIDLEVLSNKHVRRRGEPVDLITGEGAWDILRRPSSALRDPTLWTEDELTIRTITIDATTYTRGAVVGEWTRTGPGNDDAAAADALARALAKPRANETPRTPRVLHTVTFTTAPPSGAPVTRTLQIGDRCEAIVDAKPVALDRGICEAVARLVR